MRFSRMRGLVALAVFLLVIAGCVWHAGTGTPSALGWRDIALICPVGVLEVFAADKAFIVHPLILLLVAIIGGLLVGKAFCAWACPVPHIRRFFSRNKADVERGKRGDEKRGGKGALRGDAAAKDGDAAAKDGDAAAKDGDAAAKCDSVATDGDDHMPGGHEALGAAACGDVRATRGGAHDAARPAIALPALGGKRDGVRIDSRHAVLAGAIASSFAFGFPVFCLICPVGLSFAVVIGIWNLFQFNEASWGLIIFPLLVLAEVVLFRRWCTTFCPISALLSLIAAKSPLLRPRVDQATCLRSQGGDCKACVSVCPEQVDPHTASIPECSKCGDCAAVCPAQAIAIKLLPLKEPQEDGVSSSGRSS